ncbi:MOSC domain-containing protein [Nakamurella sp. YIM 132087]|uniref:MOSC domain-containing protein n=1 Tax=Nakamurella alba TaxID=2665158 RepID=A0A7K1FP03_9ACTN|nr:MOSC domain-containing protein [Nakamurella alba]MTD15049.1 MOSC domain-containing protein [Nakamurella alba]
MTTVLTALPTARLLQVRLGGIAILGSSGIRTGIDKQEVAGSIRIGPHGLDGDLHAETFHGGAEKAILQYDPAHYDRWREEFPENSERFVPGAFGENFVAHGFSETTLCIGDVVRAGTALLQVSESRQPCFKLNHRMGHPDISRRSQATGRTGWMYRVLQPGEVAEGDLLEVIDRPLPDWPISRVQRYLYDEIDNLAAAAQLAELELLSPGFRTLFRNRLENSEIEDWESRLSNGSLPTGTVRWWEADVAEIVEETATVRSFRLTAVDGAEWPAYEAGAHVDIKVDNALTRSYSLCTLPAADGYRIAVALATDGRGGSRHLHGGVQIGDRITVSAPRNHFPLAAGPGPHVMVAGGIGITPFLSMIEQLEADGTDWNLHYLCRSADAAAFHPALSRAYGTRVRLHVTDGDPLRRIDLAALVADLPASAHLYCCGPTTLMAALREAAADRPDGTVHLESFAGPAAPGVADCAPFTARIASTGETLDIPADSTLLAELRTAGIPVESSCETGTCGTCRVGVLAGDVEHRDLVLSPRERKLCMAACVSRATGTVLLDL